MLNKISKLRTTKNKEGFLFFPFSHDTTLTQQEVFAWIKLFGKDTTSGKKGFSRFFGYHGKNERYKIVHTMTYTSKPPYSKKLKFSNIYHWVQSVRIWSFSGLYFPGSGLNTETY